MKKITAFILCFAMVLAFAACGKKPQPKEEIKVPEKKVAILVEPAEKNPEEYYAAKALEEKYPDTVVVKELPDSSVLKAGDPEIITVTEEISKDDSFGAIIYARASNFAFDAISRIKNAGSEIVTVCIEPECPVQKLANISDLIIGADWEKAADDMVKTAKESGAEYFTVFSFNRHLNNEICSDLCGFIENACKENGISYVYDNAGDNFNAGGSIITNRYMKEVFPRLVNNNRIKGENVAMFSTDSTVQKELVNQAETKGYIYICPSFPSISSGIGEYYEVEYNKSSKEYLSALKSAANAEKDGKGRLWAYNFNLASVLLNAALESTFDILTEAITKENMSEKVCSRLDSQTDNKGFSSRAFKEYDNVFVAYCGDAFVKVK